jgi:hypothetical protein
MRMMQLDGQPLSLSEIAAESDVRAQLAGTAFQDAPIVRREGNKWVKSKFLDVSQMATC